MLTNTLSKNEGTALLQGKSKSMGLDIALVSAKRILKLTLLVFFILAAIYLCNSDAWDVFLFPMWHIYEL